LVLLALWSLRPLHDQVPTGVVDGARTSVTVSCARPLSADPGPTEALPELSPSAAFEREPCVQQHRENRRMLWLNVVLIAGAAAALAYSSSRHRRGDRRAVEAAAG
jgi:hypothetical protein